MKLLNGANFIIVSTNDGWFGNTFAVQEHFRKLNIIAAETGMNFIQSANTGISAFVNPRGDILQNTDWWEEAVIRGEIRLSNKLTTFVIYGDIIGRVSGFTAVLMLIYTIFKWLRSFGVKLKPENEEEVNS